eukprot:CAMPEP_0202033884 /NCGR_PEP_ID=MMETSP0905-20130828/66276_1 /ASSEMBLY_ACC=CAM_ASM_000554 /TAXON_ID=420261 /ORGANISM="Thalassiosira antarctica, Strain CCMP982" /LENGTH=476 /DNA_ID=CAMNT_0048597797 /DNA_START=166 /DNA_END=1596 /DNA_ORIENTATION=-
MDSYNWHDAQAEMWYITSCEKNREILRRLKDNDPDFTEVSVNAQDQPAAGEYVFIPTCLRELGWLGYFIGNNTICSGIEKFCRGLSRNRSIQTITFRYLSDGETFQMMSQFFKRNHNLMEIEVRESALGAEGSRLLSLAIGGCSKSLTRFALSLYEDRRIGDVELVDIIVSLSMHPQLEKLGFSAIFGRNESMALATLLRWTTIELQSLDLNNNEIDDEGLEALVGALANGNKLRKLILCNNFIRARGWRAISTLLASPNCNLEQVFFTDNRINDEGAVIFASVLANNCKLKRLALSYNAAITAEGWAAFSKLLCNTSSVNKTFLSNHTLQDMGGRDATVPPDVSSYLDLNTGTDKKQVAIIKILQNHHHFNMQPLFEWDFKALPLVIGWFERAAACPTDFNANIGNRKLSSIYQFIRGIPPLYIESRLNQELSEVCATEMKLELTLKLQDIKQRKRNVEGGCIFYSSAPGGWLDL